MSDRASPRRRSPARAVRPSALRHPSAAARGRAPERLARAFRALPLPVIGRIAEGALLFDLRCLDDEAAFLGQLGALAWPERRP